MSLLFQIPVKGGGICYVFHCSSSGCPLPVKSGNLGGLEKPLRIQLIWGKNWKDNECWEEKWRVRELEGNFWKNKSQVYFLFYFFFCLSFFSPVEGKKVAFEFWKTGSGKPWKVWENHLCWKVDTVELLLLVFKIFLILKRIYAYNFLHNAPMPLRTWKFGLGNEPGGGGLVMAVIELIKIEEDCNWEVGTAMGKALFQTPFREAEIGCVFCGVRIFKSHLKVGKLVTFLTVLVTLNSFQDFPCFERNVEVHGSSFLW